MVLSALGDKQHISRPDCTALVPDLRLAVTAGNDLKFTAATLGPGIVAARSIEPDPEGATAVGCVRSITVAWNSVKPRLVAAQVGFSPIFGFIHAVAVEDHPDCEMVGEVFETVRRLGRYKERIASNKFSALAAGKQTAATCGNQI